jgi:hypothetical protein
MSVYNDVLYKSETEKLEKKLPFNNEVYPAKSFEKDFVEVFNDVTTAEIKSSTYMNDLEKKNFDFIHNKQQKVDSNFFNNSKSFTGGQSQNLKTEEAVLNHKIEFMIEYLKEFYGAVITPQILKKIMSDFSSNKKLRLNEIECQKIMYNNFRKNTINLSEKEDFENFKKFFKSSFF